MLISHRLQAILLSHFMLNLNEANGDSGPDESERCTVSHISDLRFTHVLGSLAGSLAWGLEGTTTESLCMEDDSEHEEETPEPVAV